MAEKGIYLFPNAPEQWQYHFSSVWVWTEEEIIEFLKNLATNKPFVDALTDSTVADPADVVTAAQRILAMLNTPGLGSVREGDIDDKRFSFKYCGVSIRFLTVYDQLGFILSATGTLPPSLTNNPDGDYYLPLLSLYAKWCKWLADQCMEAGQQMQHIAYFPPAKNDNKIRVLLGSSIGSKTAQTRLKVLNDRIAQMANQGLERPASDVNVDARNYGVCAETLLFIYYANLKKKAEQNRAYGFALNTNEKNWDEIKFYDEYTMSGLLRNPCQQSCQGVMKQLGLELEWFTKPEVDADEEDTDKVDTNEGDTNEMNTD